MRKLAIWSAIATLTAVFLCCALGAVAALDELTRVPFYDSLPVVALLVNAASLLFVCNVGRIKTARRFFVKIASINVVRLRKPSLAFLGFGRLRDTQHPSDNYTKGRSRPMPAPQEIEAALRKIH